ncbi:hypothetical protein A5725_13745 [Mycobacterium kubicae]|nr:hypothetical protein A5725_13745 [Mycobacterium kubicae]
MVRRPRTAHIARFAGEDAFQIYLLLFPDSRSSKSPTACTGIRLMSYDGAANWTASSICFVA